MSESDSDRGKPKVQPIGKPDGSLAKLIELGKRGPHIPDRSAAEPHAVISDGLQRLYSGEEEYRQLLQQEERQTPKRTQFKTPTEAEFNEWVRPNDVLTAPGHRLEASAEKWAILEQLRGGVIRAVARNAQIAQGTGSVERFALITVGPWRRMSPDAEFRFWETGNLVVEGHKEDGTDDTQRYFDVRFDPDTLSGRPPVEPIPDEPIPPAAKAAPTIGAPASAGRPVGRPTKAYWEELLVEMMRQIWVGDLKPRRQADVQHAMAEWLVEQGYVEPKPTALKERARLIFQVYEAERDRE